MYCRNCGKELKEGAKFCGACGSAQTDMGDQRVNSFYKEMKEMNFQNQAPAKDAPWNILCVVGLVISVISAFVPLYGLYGIVSVCGALISHKGYRQAKASREKGTVIAVIGILIGWAVTILLALYMFLVILTEVTR